VEPPVISVVVPVRDGEATLPSLLDALAAQRGAPPFEVVVADDGSGDGADRIASGHPVVARVVAVGRPGGAPRGPGAARDAALAVATGTWIAFTDADCVPDPGWLAALAAAAAEGDAIVQGPIALPEGARPGPFDRVVARTGPNALHETANLAAPRSAVLAVGGFGSAGIRPRRGKELGEDVMLGTALRRAGLPLRWRPDARVVHPVERRGWSAAAAERRRSAAFCALVRRRPELRDDLLWRRWFLSRSTAELDLALVGAGLVARGIVVLARTGRRRGTVEPARRSPAVGRRTSRASAAASIAAGVAAATPYVRTLERRTRPWPRGRRPAIAGGLLAGDVVAAASLLAGSLRQRTPVL